MTSHMPEFFLSQKFTMTVNRYDVLSSEGGTPGAVLATAQQKRLAAKEQVTFYQDEDRNEPIFSFKARQRIDLGAEYDVTDDAGNAIGYFKKDFAASMLRSTFHLSADGVEATGQERNPAFALIRRFINVPLPINFDFVNASGGVVLNSTRNLGVRDKYRVTVPDERLDWRVAAAVAVALDALMGR